MAFKDTAKELLEKYKADHTHPMNKATHMIGIPMIIVSFPALVVSPLWALGLFVVGWILQFVGHAFEGNMPSFFRDPRYLLIGPMFVVKKFQALFGRKDSRSPSKAA
ncbi:MAG: YGL010W-like membrane protein [Myxococcota bacterium]|jgi:uncharacterized membrane protein YGL010W